LEFAHREGDAQQLNRPMQPDSARKNGKGDTGGREGLDGGGGMQLGVAFKLQRLEGDLVVGQRVKLRKQCVFRRQVGEKGGLSYRWRR